jgi:hypothetical protein
MSSRVDQKLCLTFSRTFQITKESSSYSLPNSLPRDSLSMKSPKVMTHQASWLIQESLTRPLTRLPQWDMWIWMEMETTNSLSTITSSSTKRLEFSCMMFQLTFSLETSTKDRLPVVSRMLLTIWFRICALAGHMWSTLPKLLLLTLL